MAAQGQPQLIRTAGNVQQRQQMDPERQQNLLRIQQLQRELNEMQQREQLFKAQQASIAKNLFQMCLNESVVGNTVVFN